MSAIGLGVLHQDWWWWDSNALVFGFIPIGLGAHILFSILAASLWMFAVWFAWPSSLDREDTSQ